MSVREEALKMHKDAQGKMEIVSKVEIKDKKDLALAYTPGVAEPCKEIAQNKELAYTYTMKANTIAVVSDGTAVLGLGDIGPEAAMPVMEGKCILFKNFAGINAVPICLDTKDTDEIVNIIKALAPSFGGINLEDIAAPRCFEIERRLKEEIDIPVFHDDQHGTAIVVLAGIINALKVVKKKKEEISVVINGAGAAGIAIGKLLLSYGMSNLILCDRSGALAEGEAWMNEAQAEMAVKTNPINKKGNLEEIIKGADVFVGVSAPNVVTKEMIATMNQDAICFAMANPIPEIMPEEAKKGGAKVIGTGRSDFPNQVNNLLAFPGIFKGVLEARAKVITEEMKLAAAVAIADIVKEDELHTEYILPDVFHPEVASAVAEAVKKNSFNF